MQIFSRSRKVGHFSATLIAPNANTNIPANIAKTILETVKTSTYPGLSGDDYRYLIQNLHTVSPNVFDNVPATLTAEISPATARTQITNAYHALKVGTSDRSSGWFMFLMFAKLHAHSVGGVTEYIIQHNHPNSWIQAEERSVLLRDWSIAIVDSQRGNWNEWQRRCFAVRERLHRKEEQEMLRAGAMVLLCRIKDMTHQVVHHYPRGVPEGADNIEAELRLLGETSEA